MKKMLIAFLLTGCLLVIYLTIRAGSTAWGIGIGLTHTGCGPGCYTFTAAPIPDNGTNGYSYFWFFDDGAYAITNVNTVSHTFQGFHNSTVSGNSNRNVHVEVTKLYEKGDKPIAVPNNGLTINIPADEIAEPVTTGFPLSMICPTEPLYRGISSPISSCTESFAKTNKTMLRPIRLPSPTIAAN